MAHPNMGSTIIIHFKFEHKIGAYSLGMSEMLTSSSTHVLHISFKLILSDVELIAGPNSEKLIILSRNKKVQLLKHVANAMQCVEDFVLESALVAFGCL